MNTLAEPTSTEQRALNRSRQLDPTLARTTRVRSGVYRVEGETGDYLVTVDRAGYHCQCKGARNGLKCWHAASTFRRRLAERSARLATRPAGAEARAGVGTGTRYRAELWPEAY